MNELSVLLIALLVIFLFASAFVGLLVSLPMLFVSMLQMRMHVKPERDRHKKFLYNKFNAIFFPEFLDHVGKEARKKVFFWLKNIGLSGVLGVIAFAIMTSSSPGFLSA